MALSMSAAKAPALKKTNAFTSRVNSRVHSIRAAPRPAKQVTRALSEVNFVIGGATVAALTLGRFVFLPFQRKTNEKAGLPVQNGVTHFDAGDKYAQEASFVLKTNDPAGFNVIDVFAWGALGHAVGYAALAANSLSTL